MADSILDAAGKIDQERKQNPFPQPLVEATPVPTQQTEAEAIKHAVDRRDRIGSQIDTVNLAGQKASAVASLNREASSLNTQDQILKDTGTTTVNNLRSDISTEPVVESTMQKILRFFGGRK